MYITNRFTNLKKKVAYAVYSVHASVPFWVQPVCQVKPEIQLKCEVCVNEWLVEPGWLVQIEGEDFPVFLHLLVFLTFIYIC